jgi:hexokinase
LLKSLVSLVEHYPNYESSMRYSLKVLVGEDIEKRIEIGLAKDGSGVGGKLRKITKPCDC